MSNVVRSYSKVRPQGKLNITQLNDGARNDTFIKAICFCLITKARTRLKVNAIDLNVRTRIGTFIK